MQLLGKTVEGFGEADRVFKAAFDRLTGFRGQDVQITVRGTIYKSQTDESSPFTRTTVVLSADNPDELRKRYMSLVRDELESRITENGSDGDGVYADSVTIEPYNPPPPPPVPAARPEIWERNTFGGYVRRSTRQAFENAAAFVKRKGRWYRKTRTAWVQAGVKVTRWSYRLSSASERKRYG